MTWRTHALTGVNSLWLLTVVPDGVTPSNVAWLSAVTAVGSLLLDLDAAASKLKHLRVGGMKPFALLSPSLHRALGHRGLLHSLVGLGIIVSLALSLAPWWGWQPSVALVLGSASHLLTDSATRTGIPLLYSNAQRWHLLPQSLRIVTGSPTEDAVLPFLVAGAALLLLSHLPLT
jgi:membrane-bound metal-dependent hydrolase YbcI (DUF457 family)